MDQPSEAGKSPAKPRSASADVPLLGLILLLGAVYLALLATRVGRLDSVWSIDQGVRIEHIESLLATRFHALDTIYPGRPIDPKDEFTPLLGQYLYRNRRSYSMFSVVFSALSSLPYRLFSYPGLYVLPIASTLAILLLAGRLTKDLMGTRWRRALTLVLGLTTPLMFYSLVFWDHTLVSMLLLLALHRSVRPAEGSEVRRLAGAGVAIGLAAWFRPEAALAVVALSAALAWTQKPPPWKAIGALAAGAIAASIPVWLFNQVAYGSFLGPHVLVAGRVVYLLPNARPLLARRVDWATFLIVPPAEAILVAVAALLVLRALARPAGGSSRRIRLLALSATVLTIVGAVLLASPSDGLQTTLVQTAPLALLWLLPAPAARGEEPKPRPPVSGSAALVGRRLAIFGTLYITLAWLAGVPDGGNQWGPRLLLPAIVPLLIAAVLRLAQWSEGPLPRTARICLAAAFLTLGAAGLSSELRGLGAIRTANESARRFSDVVQQSGVRVVICSDTIVPKLLAPIFYRGYLVFRSETPVRLAKLASRLGDHGLRRFLVIDRPEIGLLADPAANPGIVAEGPPLPIAKGYQLTVAHLR